MRLLYGGPLVELYEGRIDGHSVRIAMLTEAGGADPGTRRRFIEAASASAGPGGSYTPIEDCDLDAQRPWAATRVSEHRDERGAERLVEAVGSAAPSATFARRIIPTLPGIPDSHPGRFLPFLVAGAMLLGVAAGYGAAQWGDAAGRGEQQPGQDAAATGGEVPAAPFLDPPPAEPEPAEVPDVSVVGPAFTEEDPVQVHASGPGYPFAFRLPEAGWECSFLAEGEARQRCVNDEEGTGDWTLRAQITWRPCPHDCPAQTAEQMEVDWIEPWDSWVAQEADLQPFDSDTGYDELSGRIDGEEHYILVLSYFFESDDGPSHVGVVADGVAEETETVQKIVNDIRTQAEAAGSGS
jgi:hypothetical protein